MARPMRCRKRNSTCVHWCNTSRPHLALGAIAPQQAENQHAITRKKAASTSLHETRDLAGQLNGYITLALHPLRGATPFTGRYTRSERVQCPRIGCNAHGSGVPRSQTRTTAEPGIPQPERKRPKRPYARPGTRQACDSPRCTSLRDSRSAATCSISLTLVEYACSNRIDRTKEFSCPV